MGGKLFVLYLVDTLDIVGKNICFNLEIFPLALTTIEEIKKEQYVNKFGLVFKCEKMKTNYSLYFDTLEELHYVYYPY